MKRTNTALLLSAFLAFGTTALAGTGAEFLTKAAQGDNAEVMMGNLAKTKGANAGVREFGATLVADHSKAKEEVAALAASMSVAVPSGVKPEAQSAYDKLSKMSGADFDKEFLAHMAEDHRKDIAEFTKMADAKDGKVSELAAKQLPVLKQHLSTVESLQTGRQSSMRGMQHTQHSE